MKKLILAGVLILSSIGFSKEVENRGKGPVSCVILGYSSKTDLAKAECYTEDWATSMTEAYKYTYIPAVYIRNTLGMTKIQMAQAVADEMKFQEYFNVTWERVRWIVYKNNKNTFSIEMDAPAAIRLIETVNY